MVKRDVADRSMDFSVMCKFTGRECDSPHRDCNGSPLCKLPSHSVFGWEGGCPYYCGNMRFKGGVGWGMPLSEKVERQKLLADDEGESSK
jgi:hypothetical protein